MQDKGRAIDVFFRLVPKPDAEYGIGLRVGLGQRLSKPVGVEGRKGSWDPEQQVGRASINNELIKVRSSLEPDVLESIAVPNQVNGITLGVTTVGAFFINVSGKMV